MFNDCPPLNREDKEQRRSQRRELTQMLVQMILEDPTAPVSLRLGIQLGEQGKAIHNKIFDAVSSTGLKITPESSDKEIAKAQELLEYLKLMEAGFDTFLATQRAG